MRFYLWYWCGSANLEIVPHIEPYKMPPSYVLRKAKDGDVYAKFIGPHNAFCFYAIWVPKTLVTNLRGPIAK